MFDCQEVNGVSVIKPDSRLSGEDMTEFSECIRSLIEQGKTRFVLNLEKVPYLTSMGLGTMCELSKQLEPMNGWIRFAVVNEDLESVLSFMLLDDTFQIFSTVDAAVKTD